MRFFKLNSVTLAFLLLASLACAASAQPEPEADAQKTMTFRLRANASTGYNWQWSAKGEGEITLQSEDYEQRESIPGAPGVAVFNFAGVKPGKLELRFTYSQSWQPKPTDQVNSYQLEVLPDLSIIQLDMSEDIVSNLKPKF